jgi:glycosyltransferase involved in cell wall biosynthesis
MRILMVAQFYPPTIGGEEQHVRNLSIGLAARGHDVAVATLGRQGLPTFEIDEGVRVYRIHGAIERVAGLFSDPDRRHAPPFPDPQIAGALRRIITRERPDIVHAHNWLVHGFVPLKPWSNARLVLTLHDYSLRCAKKRFMYEGAPCTGPGFRKCLGCASGHYGAAIGVPTTLANWTMGIPERAAVDMFLPVSRAVADNNGLIEDDLPHQVMYNFVPDDVAHVRDGYDDYLAQLPDEDYLLFVGDLGRDKGVHVLLDAYAGLRDAPPLVLIGRPGAETPAAFPPNVRLLTNWPHAAVMGAWRRSMIGLVPSIWPDPCPTVAMEAMASGRPVIASRIGGLSDIVADGETGYLIDPGDAAALREGIARLLEDRDLRLKMGDASLRRVVAFQAGTVIPSIEHIYEGLVAAGRNAWRHRHPARRVSARLLRDATSATRAESGARDVVSPIK